MSQDVIGSDNNDIIKYDDEYIVELLADKVLDENISDMKFRNVARILINIATFNREGRLYHVPPRSISC